MFEPRSPELIIVKSRLSPEAWKARVAAARKAATKLSRVEKLVTEGSSLNAAIRQIMPRGRRSWAMRRWRGFLKLGVEALFDFRLPREPRVSSRVREHVEAAVASGASRFEDVVRGLREAGVTSLPSPATLKREIARAKGRRATQRPGRTDVLTTDLPLAGGELLLAAEIETGGIAALTDVVEEISREAVEASTGQTPTRDVAYRDRRGRFTVTYNRKRRRKRGEKVASYLRSATEKAAGRVPAWPRFVHEKRRTLDAKMRMLVFEPIVSRTKGWAGLRSPEAEGLKPIVGLAYMPSTLAKFASAVAISGGGPRLLAAAGERWHAVAQERWAEAGAMAALYVDNHSKEVWSSLFTQSGKVSRLNRVMPSITMTYVHTGAGTPMVMGVQSGSAPLAPALVGLVDRAEAALGDDIQRAVVIDSEGSTFDILESFAKRRRVVITPLRPSRAPELEIRHTRGSYFRPYRDNDELRIGHATLRHRATGRVLEVGVLLVRRDHRESDRVLLTTGLALGMEGRDLADIYFARWPLQENWFRAGAAVGLDEHRGNCGRMVANMAIVTEAERLETRLREGRSKLDDLRETDDELTIAAGDALLAYERSQRLLARKRVRLDKISTRSAPGSKGSRAFVTAAAEHHAALGSAEKLESKSRAALVRADKARARLEKAEADIAKSSARLAKIEPQREIRQLDVALDSIHTATKLTAVQLMSFVIREYLPHQAMDLQTFIARVFPVRGRRDLGQEEETIVFYANARDPEVSEALGRACEILNARKLERNGRRLRYAVEDSPPAPGERPLRIRSR